MKLTDRGDGDEIGMTGREGRGKGGGKREDAGGDEVFNEKEGRVEREGAGEEVIEEMIENERGVLASN